MSNNNSNKPEEEKKETLFPKNWKEFSTGIQDGFYKFQNSLQEQAKINQEVWNKSKEKASELLRKSKEKFDAQLVKWSNDMKKMQDETKEQWDARTNKIKQDIEQFQQKSRDEFSKGMKSITRGFYKWYFIFLLMLIPILIIVVVVVVLISQLIPS
ncbi:MAG: hypothetical protein ACFFBP_02760 [Promethearchaeota archaeon]